MQLLLGRLRANDPNVRIGLRLEGRKALLFTAWELLCPANSSAIFPVENKAEKESVTDCALDVWIGV